MMLSYFYKINIFTTLKTYIFNKLIRLFSLCVPYFTGNKQLTDGQGYLYFSYYCFVSDNKELN